MAQLPNAPSISRNPNFFSLHDICAQLDAVLDMHTSNKYHGYHLQRNSNGKIVKAAWAPGKITLDENVINLVRKFRMLQEQFHAAKKGMFKIFDMRNFGSVPE